MSQPHLSVLYREVSSAFSFIPCKIFVDCTLGAGGHAATLLETHPEIEQYIGIDQDPEALKIAKQRLEPWGSKLRLVRGNFVDLTKHLTDLNIRHVDGMLLDLGVSSMQLDRAEKGFSFMRDGPLDMRMDPDGALSAADIVNTFSEQEIGKILRDYGEEKQWRNAAKTIIAARAKGPITTTKQLVEVLMPLLGWRRGKGIHPLTLVFQGLRIYVNDELGVLERVLPEAIQLLATGGRLAVISFHSLEDRIVKNCFREAASDKMDCQGLGGIFLSKEPLVKAITSRPLIAQADEQEENSRSRSAKLRVIEKLGMISE
jgi:16S rRNA (cytosine1402-N4)-methyltransferase